ncbi:MAG: hypothetical protein ACJ71O_14435 [Nitrososphaeraceae archaeon]
MEMKKFKIEFSLALIPALAMTMSALLVTIFSTTVNIANANSFPFSPISSSSVQSQLPHQQQDTNAPMITTNSNGLQLTDHLLPFLPPLQQSKSQPSQPQQQQQMNQPPLQNPLNASRISNSHNNIFDNHSPTIVSILPF